MVKKLIQIINIFYNSKNRKTERYIIQVFEYHRDNISYEIGILFDDEEVGAD